MRDVRILDVAFDPEIALSDFRRQCGPETGALVSFTGLVRGDAQTSALRLSHYPEFTERAIMTFVDTAYTRWSIQAALIIHRVGDMRVGEPIVLVATASAHRRTAFEAADYLMDYLKSAAPFWKQEICGQTASWIEPRAQDKTDKQRWES